MNVKEELQTLNTMGEEMQFNSVVVEPEKIRAIMINEIVPANPADDFYGGPEAAYLSTTIPLFKKAGIQVDSIQEFINIVSPLGKGAVQTFFWLFYALSEDAFALAGTTFGRIYIQFLRTRPNRRFLRGRVESINYDRFITRPSGLNLHAP